MMSAAVRVPLTERRIRRARRACMSSRLAMRSRWSRERDAVAGQHDGDVLVGRRAHRREVLDERAAAARAMATSTGSRSSIGTCAIGFEETFSSRWSPPTSRPPAASRKIVSVGLWPGRSNTVNVRPPATSSLARRDDVASTVTPSA